MNDKRHEMFFRSSFFIIGLILFAFGITITIAADFGLSAWDAFSVGLFNQFKLSIGTWMNVTSLLLILLGGILRHERPRMSSMITSAVLSAFVDVLVFLMADIVIEAWTLKAIVYLLGVLVVSMGCGTYLISNFPPCPIDTFMMALKESFHTDIRTAMTVCEGSGFLLAFIVSGPIGIGTILSVFIYGPLIQFFHQTARIIYQSLLTAFPEVVHNAVDI